MRAHLAPHSVINLVRKLNYSDGRSAPDTPGQGNNLKDETQNGCLIIHIQVYPNKYRKETLLASTDFLGGVHHARIYIRQVIRKLNKTNTRGYGDWKLIILDLDRNRAEDKYGQMMMTWDAGVKENC